jgi:hypothetical protein
MKNIIPFPIDRKNAIALPLEEAKEKAEKISQSLYNAANGEDDKTKECALHLAQYFEEIGFLIQQGLTALAIITGNKKAD